MWIEIGPIATKLARGTDEERGWIIDYLSFKDATAHFRGAKTDKICLFNRFTSSFPTGLLPLVERAAPEAGFKIERIDHRAVPCAPDPNADLAWLRDYQLAAVRSVLRSTRGILHISTGGGKTEIFIGLTRALPCRWLFLCHRSTLIEGAASRFELRSPGVPVGRIGDGTWNVPPDAQVVCATFQTIYRGLIAGDKRVLALLEGAQGLAVDECHTLPAGTFYKVAQACPAYYRVGLSGTPLARGDQRSTYAIAALGPIIHRVGTEVLVEAGVLARAHIRMIRCRQRSKKPTWQGVYGDAIVRGSVRNKIIVEACKRAEKPCLLFVKEIGHGKSLERALTRQGISTNFVHGKHGLDQRERAKKDLVRGRHEVLICSVIFQEGEDMPALRSVVIAGGGKSVIAALQRIGRGMRTAEDKTDFEVYDVADLGCACMTLPAGYRHAGCKWLDRHTRDRLKAYASEGHETILEDWIYSAPQPADDPDTEPSGASPEDA